MKSRSNLCDFAATTSRQEMVVAVVVRRDVAVADFDADAAHLLGGISGTPPTIEHLHTRWAQCCAR